MTREEEMALLVKEIEKFQRDATATAKMCREEIKARRERLHKLAHDVETGQLTLGED
ncbi:MAG TPA: hypothetical protein PLS95_00895 [Thermoanaerobaculales bacterium]|nr:hypothetical protein [Thermoanaerobaculales bacterium]